MYPSDVDYLKAVFESATHHGVLVTDNSGVITLHNSAAAAIFHYRRDDLVGLDVRLLFTPEDREQRVLGPERIEVNTDCGLRTRTWEVSLGKLKNMVEGTRLAEEALNGS